MFVHSRLSAFAREVRRKALDLLVAQPELLTHRGLLPPFPGSERLLPLFQPREAADGLRGYERGYAEAYRVTGPGQHLSRSSTIQSWLPFSAFSWLQTKTRRSRALERPYRSCSGFM